jgi:heavy metal sensor kinase
MIKSFRLQLTAWYLLFFTLLFMLFSIFLYEVLARALHKRMDETLSSELNTAVGMLGDEMAEGRGDTHRAAQEAMSQMKVRGVLLAVYQDGELLASTAPFQNADLSAVVAQADAAHDPEILTGVPRYGVNGGRAVARRFIVSGRQYVLVAVESLDAVTADLAVVRNVIFIALPLAVLMAGIGGFILATKSLAPLRWMADQARNITDKNLHSRLDIGAAHEELQLLSKSFNELLSRLDRAFETMQRFVADASHELRTPIAVIRGEADVALNQERKPAEYRDSLTIIQDEARRLSRLIDDLLNLTRADAGHVTLRVEEFYFNDLLAECCRSMHTVADAKQIGLECRCPEDVSFHGDQELLRRLVLNLLDNAIRYTPDGGKISVELQREDGELRLQVADTGAGIDPEAAGHVFERFYRGDQARSRQNGGFGLGLSIVKWIAESHNGTVEVSSKPGKGSTFTVLLHRQHS